jgi:hypothetical protein
MTDNRFGLLANRLPFERLPMLHRLSAYGYLVAAYR